MNPVHQIKVDIFVSSDIAYDQRVLKVARTLRDAGYDIRVTGRYKSGSDVPLPKNMKVKLIRGLPRSGVIFYLLLNVAFFFRGLFSKAKIFIACDLDTLPGTWLASRIKGKKLVFDAHEHFVESPELIGRRVKKYIWQIAANWLIPKVDMAITVNQELAVLLQKLYKINFHVIRNLPPAKDRSFLSSREKVIWYQGAVNDGRMLETLIDALEYIPGFTIQIAGDGDLLSSLKKYAQRKQLNSGVIFHGRLTYDEMQEKASRCLLGFNLLADKGDNYRYSLANKFFDYVQIGLPSINSEFPVYRRYLKEWKVGILLAPNISARELANQIEAITTDTDLYESFVDSCKTAKAEWTWEREKVKLITLINSIKP